MKFFLLFVLFVAIGLSVEVGFSVAQLCIERQKLYTSRVSPDSKPGGYFPLFTLHNLRFSFFSHISLFLVEFSD